MMKTTKKSFVVLLTYVSLLTPAASMDPVLANIQSPDSVGNSIDDHGNITWADIPQGEPYKADAEYSDGGMGPLFDFSRSFINTCLQKGFPYDLIEKIQNGHFDMAEAQGVALDYLGYGLAIVVGLLFIVIFPLIGCCFCCCRCCGNCGGKRIHKDDPSASCKRKIFGVVLLLLVVMTSAGMVCVFVSNDRMSTALNKFGDTAADNIDDISTFLDNTIEQVKHVAGDNFNFTKKAIFRDLDSLGHLVGIPVRESLGISGGVNAAFSSALALQGDLDNATTHLSSVLDQIQYLNGSATQLKTDLAAVKSQIDTACSGGPCTGAPDTSGLRMGFDESRLPDFNTEKSRLDGLQNLTMTILKAKAEFDSVPERVQNETTSTVATLKTQVDKYSESVDPMIKMTTNLKSQALGSFDLNSMRSQVESYTEDVAVYDRYRWYAGIGLTSVILLIVLLLFLGLTCGVCGSSASNLPTERGCLSNCGGNLLMGSVGLIFMFSWLLMLLTTLTFTIGAPLERFVCQPLSDPELTIFTKLFDEMHLLGGSDNGSFLGQMLFQDPSIDLTVANILKDCKSGKAAYSAFRLDNFKDFNITALVDYKSSLDIDGQLNGINVDLSSLTILTPDVQTQLKDFSSVVSGIDFTKFDMLSNDTVGTNLSLLAEDLRNVNQTNLSSAADTLDSIANGSFHDTNNAKNNLVGSSNSLQSSVSNIPTTISNVTQSLNNTQEYLQNNGSEAVKSEAKNFANRLTAIVDSFVEDARYGLENEIGRCTPIYNIYASMLVNGFCRYTLDALNGFWFSIGWCVFFFLPSVIFAVKLAKYYRKMEMLDSFDNPLPNKVGHADRW
ncbi:prominin-1-like isoform X3 [Haliotis rufescens]|uniref:prominin-1-like isoform X3 n=1 Tax=Haliotis rufescens TaxID=6454 RepID=UPI00201EB69A|nr:prominin-1-like isoform X3 [Haliotis rufescens]